MRYFDTGVLLKLYLPEPRADEAVAFVDESPCKPPVTPLHELEMRPRPAAKSRPWQIDSTPADARNRVKCR